MHVLKEGLTHASCCKLERDEREVTAAFKALNLNIPLKKEKKVTHPVCRPHFSPSRSICRCRFPVCTRDGRGDIVCGRRAGVASYLPALCLLRLRSCRRFTLHTLTLASLHLLPFFPGKASRFSCIAPGALLPLRLPATLHPPHPPLPPPSTLHYFLPL